MPVLRNVTMRSQWGPGFGLFVDLNCGWYAQVAAMDWWARSLGYRMPANPNDLLPHHRTRFGFSPDDEGSDLAQTLTKPGSPQEWESLLERRGPVIVGGKLGAADWGAMGGVGHYILIVGADAGARTLSYKDPLQGDQLRTDTFAHLDARMQDDVYVIRYEELARRLRR